MFTFKSYSILGYYNELSEPVAQSVCYNKVSVSAWCVSQRGVVRLIKTAITVK